MGKETEAIQALEEKIDKGETLTPEEEKLLEGAPTPEPEEIDPEKVIIKDEKDEKEKKTSKTSVTPDEKDAEAAKAKEKEAAETAAKEAERKKEIEADAEKPIDQVDIEKYTPRERGLFFEARKERKKRQDVELERDTLKFQRAKDDAKALVERERAEAEARAKEEAENDPFKGMEDDDLLTAGQLKKLLATRKQTETGKESPELQKERLRAVNLQSEVWIMRAQSKIPDAVEICNVGGPLLDLENDKVARAEVEDAVAKGGNPVIATVNYIKAHPKWPEIEAKLKAKTVLTEDEKKKAEADKTNKERAERIEANKKKPVTTGSGGGAPASGEYSIQEILDMPDAEYQKLPKAQREKILETLG